MAANPKAALTPQRAKIVAWAIVITVLTLALFGFVVFLWLLAPHMGSALRWLIGALFALGASMVEKPEVITAIATAALVVATFATYRATSALSRSTNVLQTLDGPFLFILAIPDGGFPGFAVPTDNLGNPINFPQYPFTADDQGDVNLGPLLKGNQASYINVIAYNRATKPASAAAEVEITVVLFYGATSGAAPNHPFSKRRTLSIPIIEVNSFNAQRLFNVAGMPGYLVQVESVTYRDILARPRSAATGVGVINFSPPGNLSYSLRVFKPRKGEYTSAIRD